MEVKDFQSVKDAKKQAEYDLRFYNEMMGEKKAPFQGKPVKCRKCGDVIASRYYGEYVTCKCGAISVDQTPYYSRYIGEPSDFDHNSSN